MSDCGRHLPPKSPTVARLLRQPCTLSASSRSFRDTAIYSQVVDSSSFSERWYQRSLATIIGPHLVPQAHGFSKCSPDLELQHGSVATELCTEYLFKAPHPIHNRLSGQSLGDIGTAGSFESSAQTEPFQGFPLLVLFASEDFERCPFNLGTHNQTNFERA